MKAAFTRALNKETHLTPYASSTSVGKSSRSVGPSNEEYNDLEDESSNEEEEDVEKDAMVPL